MIRVQSLTPLYTKITGSKMSLVFAYQQLSLVKENELFHFIPLDGKEMIVDLNTYKIDNVSDVFVFQKGHRFIRIPLSKLLHASNIYDHLLPIIKEKMANDDSESVAIIRTLEQQNAQRLIDRALDERDASKFHNILWHMDARGLS